ncbi:MAG: hypothetical protein V7754_06755 [Halioglobus sp.]
MATLRTARWIGFALVAALGVTAAINSPLFDQHPGTDVLRILSTPPNSESPGELIRQSLTVPDSNNALEDFTRCAPRTQLGCLAVLREDMAAGEPGTLREIDKNLTEYRKLLQSRDFHHLVKSSSDAATPQWGVILQLAQLNLALVSRDSSEQFIRTLESDIRFWKLLYREGHSMLEKMVAVAGLWTDHQFVSEYLLLEDVDEEVLNKLNEILLTSGLEPTTLVTAYENEFRNLAGLLTPPDSQVLAQAYGISPWRTMLLLQPQATMNQYYAQAIAPAICLAGLPVAALLTEQQDGTQCSSDLFFKRAVGTWSLYNPAGQTLVGAAAGAAGYIFRIHDFQGLRGMVQYQLALLGQGKARMVDYLDPALGATASSDQIAFNCLEQGNSLCQVTINTESETGQ